MQQTGLGSSFQTLTRVAGSIPKAEDPEPGGQPVRQIPPPLPTANCPTFQIFHFVLSWCAAHAALLT